MESHSLAGSEPVTATESPFCSLDLRLLVNQPARFSPVDGSVFDAGRNPRALTMFACLDPARRAGRSGPEDTETHTDGYRTRFADQTHD